MAEVQAGAGKKEFLKAVIVLVIAFSGWFIPAPAPMTEIGMRCVTVFLSMIVGWSLTGRAWPSLMGMLLFPATGVMTLKQFVAAGWGTDTFLFLVVAFVLVGYLKETGVSQFLANWLLGRKFLEGHPWRLIAMILFATYLICSLVNTFVGMLLMWEVVYGITHGVGQKPHDKFPSIMVFGIAMQGAFSLSAMPWGGNAIANLGVYANIMGAPADMIQYVLFMVPFGILEIMVYIALTKFIFRLDVTPLKEYKLDVSGQGELAHELKTALIMLAVFVVLLLAPSFIPKGSELATFYNSFGSAGIALLFFIVITLMYYKNKPVLNFADLATKNVPWNMLMMVAVIFAIGGCLINEKTGIAAFLSQNVVPALTSVPSSMFLLIVIAVVVLLTNFLINMVVVAMFLPVIIPICAGMGLSPELVSFGIMLASVNAILTPAGCAASSLLFPNKEWISAKEIYQYGVPTVLVNTVLIVVWCLVFPL